MFGSNTALDKKRQESLDELRQTERRLKLRLRLIDALPPGTPVPENIYPFGYCADGSLVFKASPGAEKQLLELYPPMPLVHVAGSTVTQKPEKYLHQKDRSSNIEPIYPVVIQREKGGSTFLRWWTELQGMDVEIKLYDPNGVLRLELDPQIYAPRDSTYATGSATFYRKRLVQATSLRKSSRQLWRLEWEELCNRHLWRGTQRAFVKAIRRDVEENESTPFTLAQLPEPNYLRPGTALVIPDGADMIEMVESLRKRQEARVPHAFDAIGDFWACFNNAEVEELVAFAEARRLELPQVRRAEQQELEAVARAAREFFTTRGCMVDDWHHRELVTEHLRRVTGLEVSFRGIWGDFHRGLVTLTPYFDTRDAFEDIKVPCVKGRWLRLQDVPTVYVGP